MKMSTTTLRTDDQLYRAFIKFLNAPEMQSTVDSGRQTHVWGEAAALPLFVKPFARLTRKAPCHVLQLIVVYAM